MTRILAALSAATPDDHLAVLLFVLGVIALVLMGAFV